MLKILSLFGNTTASRTTGIVVERDAMTLDMLRRKKDSLLKTRKKLLTKKQQLARRLIT